MKNPVVSEDFKAVMQVPGEHIYLCGLVVPPPIGKNMVTMFDGKQFWGWKSITEWMAETIGPWASINKRLEAVGLEYPVEFPVVYPEQPAAAPAVPVKTAEEKALEKAERLAKAKAENDAKKEAERKAKKEESAKTPSKRGAAVAPPAPKAPTTKKK